MSEFNKSYRIRTNVNQDKHLHIKLDSNYDILEIMSLKINQENAYKLHTSNYGVIAGRVLANKAFGIPNAKVSVFINIDDNDINDTIKSVLYPYNTTYSTGKNGVKYNLFPNEQVSKCHSIIGTFPEKQYVLDNDNILEIYDKYYKFTTRTNNAGDFMIFGVPVGSQTIHADVDLSDIGILSQKPRDMVYKGYNIEQFENPNKFKQDTNLESLTQVITQDNVIDVIPFWGEEEDNTIGITRCDININYKFEPTCVFMGSVVSDTNSNGFSKKCIPTPGMGAMDEITTSSGTIEMIRKTPSGDVEEFSIKGTQLINGDGVWCYQIPMNLDFMMTDEFGNTVPSDDPSKGIPTRTKVRFRISLQDFESNNTNVFRGKMLVPHNPNVYSEECADGLDYQFGTHTKDSSYRDLFWNGIYTVKSYIPRIQKGSNWKNEKFTGFKRVNYYGDKNPIPYNNIRIRLPFMYTMICTLIKTAISMSALLNKVFSIGVSSFFGKKEEEDVTPFTGAYVSISGAYCNENLETLCIIPGVKLDKLESKKRKSMACMAILNHVQEVGGIDLREEISRDANYKDYQTVFPYPTDTHSIDMNNRIITEKVQLTYDIAGKDKNSEVTLNISGITVTDSIDYLIQCIEMNLAQEFKVIQFDFYNDWINGLLYIPRWARNITKKRTYLWGALKVGGKISACNENYKGGKRNIVQQCALTYNTNNNSVINDIGCTGKNVQQNKDVKLICHKSPNVRKSYEILQNDGIVKTVETIKSQFVYYFKPYESTKGKNVRLFATDIVLLGTLNECDKWGIPHTLEDLTPTTYQMPPNLALTDSDLEGNDYESKGGSQKPIQLVLKNNLTEYVEWRFNGNLIGINPLEEDANYTEMAGVNWDYSGPMQLEGFDLALSLMPGTTTYTIDDKFYKPGGHFLGITCRNSETSIKSCVNLSRICEHGVWMSQRQVLNLPSPDEVANENEAFTVYATVPSGFISKDEISDSNYRRLFASMNQNGLKTIIDGNTGYPVYDFTPVNPINFGGDLSNLIFGSTSLAWYYNHKKTKVFTEKYYKYIDSEYLERVIESSGKTITEHNIVRTGEHVDNEYLKFRFGLNDDTLNESSERSKRYLFTSKADTSENEETIYGSFPIYDNSFYFYFGLNHGKTALDEFKKMYYAVCENMTSLVQIDRGITLTDISTRYDGVCPETPQGEVAFKVNGDSIFFANNALTVSISSKNLKEEDGPEYFFDKQVCTSPKKYMHFKGIPAGEYIITVLNNEHNVKNLFNITVDRIDVTGSLSAVPFSKDVSQLSLTELFGTDNSTRDKFQGYISIDNNEIIYKKGVDIFLREIARNSRKQHDLIEDSSLILNEFVSEVRINPFLHDVVTKIIVEYDGGSFESNPDKTCFIYSNNEVSGSSYDIIKTDNIIKIPVPQADIKYTVKLVLRHKDCKPYFGQLDNVDSYIWTIGDIYVKNGITGDVLYNGVPISIFEDDSTELSNSTSGWWNNSKNRWFFESEKTQWLVKSALFQNSLNEPHSVVLKTSGIKPPYTENISGMTETYEVSSNLTHTDLQNIMVPTINYATTINDKRKRRLNFSYQVIDGAKDIYPIQPFVFPVIYKPFFMEMLVCYFNTNDAFYLIGNVYNGKTWDYQKQGFNDTQINGTVIDNVAQITKDDMTVEITEDFLKDKNGDTITGGYDYGINDKDEYFKYNGRKVPVSRKLSDKNYSLTTENDMENFDLSIGSSTEFEGVTYSDKTFVQANKVGLYKFDVETKIIDKKYYITFNMIRNLSFSTLESRRDDNENKPTLYYIIEDKENGYTYPWDGLKPSMNDKLFRDIIGDSEEKHTISNSINPIKIDGIEYIDIANISKLFVIAISRNTENLSGTSNTENKLKLVSFSNLIDLSNIRSFYPLNITVTCTDTLQSDGSYQTTMVIKPKDDDSKNNFKNKKYVLTFYKYSIENEQIGDKIILDTITSFAHGDSITQNITSYRQILGIDNSGVKAVSYDYDVYNGMEKSPSSYLNNSMTITRQ